MVREVYNHSMVLLSAFVPLYIGLGVTAPARADFFLVLSSSSSFLLFASGAFPFNRISTSNYTVLILQLFASINRLLSL